MPEPLSLGLGPMLGPGGTEEREPGKWWYDIGVRQGHWLAAGSGVGTEGRGVSHLPARDEVAGSPRLPRCTGGPSCPCGSGNRGWPDLWGGGVLAQSTFDKESKGRGNNSSLSRWATWQE